MVPKFVSFALSKAQILEFLQLPKSIKITKEQLVEQLLRLTEIDAQERDRLLETFPYELAVGPAEVEELLHCTQVERKRWMKEGKLPVLEYRQFRKAGRDMTYPVHERRSILQISQGDIAWWRETHRVQVLAHRKAGAQMAIEHKKANAQVRQDFQLGWLQTVEAWKQCGSLELAAVFMLAYWTVWASRWAKDNHLRFLHGRKHSVLYAKRRDIWYERKNQAMRLLAQTPYARLTFYRPPEPDKHYLWLCEEHYELKCEGYYENIWDFFYHNAAMIKQCRQCSVNNEQNYYSLYHLEVMHVAFPDLRFSFHMPYPIGKAWFPSFKKLPEVEHIEQDGVFRFGRSLLPTEKVAHREEDVVRYFEQALAEVKKFYPFDEGYLAHTAGQNDVSSSSTTNPFL